MKPLAIALAVFSLLILAITAMAQDKPKDAPPATPPALTDAQKIEILKAQRTVLGDTDSMKDIQQQYQKLMVKFETDSEALQKAIKAANERAGKQWQLQADTLEFVAVPAQPNPPPPAAPTPAKK